MNTTLNTPHLSKNSCTIYRSVGSLLLIISLINLLVMFHYFLKRYCNKKKLFLPNRSSPILIGMSISSFLLIFTASPFILAQCFLCRPLFNDDFFCKMHGFICFSTGIFDMYIVALLSCHRYLSIVHKSSCLNRFFENHPALNIVLSAIISICWSTPSLFNIGNRYLPEDSGFYCSLKWNDPSLYSRIFTITILIINFIIPFFLVTYTNVRVWCILRSLLKTQYYSSSIAINKQNISIKLRKYLTDKNLKEKTNRLKKLKIDQRYAIITAILAAQYIIIWTPYACIVLAKFLDKFLFIQHYPFLPTLSALLSKISIILNPLILVYTSKMTHT